MKRILLPILALVFFLFCGCDDVLIEEYKRVEVKGILLSSENEPVPDIQIISAGVFDNYLSQDPRNLLGVGKSDENGKFEFISLDSYSHDLMFAVNPVEFEVNRSYASMYFHEPSGVHSIQYNLGRLELGRKVDFQLNISRISQAEDTLRYKIEFKRPVLHFIYENGAFVEEASGSGNFISLREHFPESEPVTYNLSTLAGSELKFSYSLGEGPVEEILIPVALENNTYDFEY